MRLIKLLLLSVVIIFLILTTIAALIPSEVRISRAIDINQPAVKIYPELSSLENWQSWNLYIQKMEEKKIFPDSIIGKVLDIRIIEKQANLISAQWSQRGGQQFRSGYKLIEHPTSTTVQWYFDFHFKWYPWEKFSSIVYDAQVGPVMQESLEKLKGVIENVP